LKNADGAETGCGDKDLCWRHMGQKEETLGIQRKTPSVAKSASDQPRRRKKIERRKSRKRAWRGVSPPEVAKVKKRVHQGKGRRHVSQMNPSGDRHQVVTREGGE